MKPRIAIIGAGLSGLTVANGLTGFADITLFEKSRGVGGRMSTRYADPFYFDHGTQFFTARSKAFKQFLKPYIESGLVAPWQGKVITLEANKKVTDRLWFEPHYVACPSMNSLCKKLSEGLQITLQTEVAPLADKINNQWHLKNASGEALGIFDVVISTAPPTQTIRLFDKHLPDDCPIKSANMLGCYTMMLGFKKPWDKSWMAAKVHNSPIEWIAINSTKPGRDAAMTSMTVHTNNAWAQQHIDDDIAVTEALLKQELSHLMDIDVYAADYFALHRWRYALLEEKEKNDPYWDAQLGLASVGDWCTASRIEDVWLSARELADAMTNC